MKHLLAFIAGGLLMLMVVQISTSVRHQENAYKPSTQALPLEDVYPILNPSRTTYEFLGYGDFFSDETAGSKRLQDRQLTVSKATQLDTISPDDVELVCATARAYNDGTHEFGAKVYLTESGQTRLQETLAQGKGELLALKFEGQTILEFITDDASLDKYSKTRQPGASMKGDPLERGSDIDLTAPKNRHFALMALIKHLSPGKPPVPCNTDDDPTEQRWWSETVDRLW